MAIATPALISALFTVFKNDFQQAFKSETPSDWQEIATQINSSSKSNTYGWMGKFPKFREWVGDRVMKSLKTSAYQIINKKWETSVAVDHDDIADDNVGIYSPMIAEMGAAAKRLPDELIFPLVADGFGAICYDGQNFFDVDHPLYPKTDGTGVATTVSNMTAGDKPAWFLIDGSRAIKPFIYQNRQKPEITAMTDPKDESVFMKDEYRFGVKARSNAGYGLWQLAHGAKVELNEANFNQAYDAMTSLKADGGSPLGIKPTILLVGNSNRAAAERLIKAREIGGTTNTLYNSVTVIHTTWMD